MQEEINIEKIMEEIKEEIKKKNYPTNLLDFEEVEYDKNIEQLNELDELKFNFNSLKSDIIYLKNNKEVQYFREYESYGKLAKLKTFIKKVIRKLTKSFIVPIVIDQNKINEKTYNALCQMCSKHKEDKEKISELENRINRLEKLLMEKNK